MKNKFKGFDYKSGWFFVCLYVFLGQIWQNAGWIHETFRLCQICCCIHTNFFFWCLTKSFFHCPGLFSHFFLIACMILARDDANNDTLTINCHMVYFNVLEIFIPPMMSREIQPIITNKLWSAICKWEPSHYEDLGQ